RVARPVRAHRACELLRGEIARSGERENLSPLESRHLGHDVRGRTESVDSNLTRITGFPQAAISNQARAEQRCRRNIRIVVGQVKTKPRVDLRVFRVASIQRITGEPGPPAQVFPLRSTELTFATRPAQPGNADAIPDRELIHV